MTERLSQMSQEDRAAWQQSRDRADRLDGYIRREPPEPVVEQPDKRPRIHEPESQLVGGQRYPPSMPSPFGAEAIHVPSSESGASGSHGLYTSAFGVRDSGDPAVALSSTDEDQDFILCIDAEDQVLLAGGRNELNLKLDKWTSPTGKQKIITGVRKEVKNVVEDKQALRPLTVEQSRHVRASQSDRIVPSKLVLVEKHDETGQDVVKARWTARGDKDPDLMALIRQGRTQSPTISSNGRYTVLQNIASNQFDIQLGDVTGAFLEADEMERGNGKLFMSPPRNFALPDHDPEQLFEVIKPIYGLNDSPQKWFTKFDKTIKTLGWKQSKLDHCIYFLWQGN